MATKKRRFQQLEAAAATPREKATYVDPFQQQVVPRLEQVGKKFEGKGRTILYAVGALVLLVVLSMIFMNWSRKSGSAAHTVLGKAIETSQAQISETGPATGSTAKTFKTEKERAEAAIAEFEAIAQKFGGAAAEKARYFVAVNRLFIDRPAAIQQLEEMAKGSGDVSKLSKFALAQTRAEDGKPDEAIALYRELLAMSDAIVAKDTINFELAKLYEKQGNRQEALDIYFNIAKTAAEEKDLDGKPVPMTQTATDAKNKVKDLDPEKAKEIPEPTPDSPFGS